MGKEIFERIISNGVKKKGDTVSNQKKADELFSLGGKTVPYTGQQSSLFNQTLYWK